MERIVRDLFMMSVFNIPYPVLILICSFVVVLPLQLYFSFEFRSKVLCILHSCFYLVLTIIYVALDAYGLHFDGVSFLVYAFLNGYLVFVCWAGWLIYAKKKDKVSKFAD